MSRNFREREAFIIIYDVTSKIQVSKLFQWYVKIQESANIADHICLFLGNNQSSRKFSKEEISCEHKKIVAAHKKDCDDCSDQQQQTCGRVIFDFVNLQTKSNLDVALRKLAKQLAQRTDNYLV